MKCKNCGAEFEEGMFCPECGTKLEEGENGTVENSVSEQPVAEAQKNIVTPKVEPRVEQKPVQERPEKNGMATASLVFGIISLVTFGSCFLTEVLGIVFACVSKKGKPMSGMAKAGLICSIVAIAVFAVLMVFLLALEA